MSKSEFYAQCRDEDRRRDRLEVAGRLRDRADEIELFYSTAERHVDARRPVPLAWIRNLLPTIRDWYADARAGARRLEE